MKPQALETCRTFTITNQYTVQMLVRIGMGFKLECGTSIDGIGKLSSNKDFSWLWRLSALDASTGPTLNVYELPSSKDMDVHQITIELEYTSSRKILMFFLYFGFYTSDGLAN